MKENEENKDQDYIEYEGSSAFSLIKKCPECGGELEKGYLHAARGMYWDTKRHRFLGIAGECLRSQWSWTIPYVPALRCDRCSLVIFHY